MCKDDEPRDFVTIDKCLYGCRNQLGFITYNPNKPAKYRINLKCLNEVGFPYTYHSEVFAGRFELEVEAEYYIPTAQGVTQVGCLVSWLFCLSISLLVTWPGR